MPDPARLKRERRLFDQALALEDPRARDAFLREACAGDEAMRRQIESLLAETGSADAFFSRPAMARPNASASAASTPGVAADPSAGAARAGTFPSGGKVADAQDYITQIGRYRLLERVGEGGHGIVYRAEQHEPVRRQVALKIIRLGMDTETVINRFDAERQALALMEHPYIARVLDAGATESGRPFFVMEWVGGVRITDYCDRQRLAVRQRIELLVKVCQAVHHAHQKGVIHRDLKPSNILVTEIDGQPVPKVIDFGIAKATGPRLTAHTLHTAELGQFIGTPAYMSPEHVVQGGLQVDTRSDIFSVGVLLSELLVGRLPFDAHDWPRLAPDEIRRLVRERQARRPSQVFRALPEADREKVAAARRTVPARLLALLPGDLDWIALKALAPEREHRYESAAALAADLRAHLVHDVVRARSPSRLYQFRKFIRRHRGPVLAVSLVLAALVVGLGAATRLYIREQRALRAQIELRRQTEEARANEAALRRRAEAGERVARAAVQISYDQLAEADALVADLPLELVQPSLESALVFRTLGTWHAQAERWEAGARYFAAHAPLITSIDLSDSDGVSFYLMPAATVIVRAGDTAGYERFRAMIVQRFGDTLHPIVAEQVMKATLLTPADQSLLGPLAPLFVIVREATLAPEADRDPFMKAWRCFALGLMEYRREHYESTLEWAAICLASPDYNGAREASGHLLVALARAGLGQHAAAKAELALAEEILNTHQTGGPEARRKLKGFWFDWVNVWILRAEARRVLAESGAGPRAPDGASS